MLVQPITVSPWQSTCYLVRAGDGDDRVVIVDPGITAADPVTHAIDEAGMTPVAMLATHGHVDHIGDAHLLADRYGIPLYLGAADQHLITRPGAGLGPQGDAMVARLTGSVDAPPVADVRDYGGPFEIAGLSVTPMPAPGHTGGSTLLTLSDGQDAVVFTGDVLFAGTIGRTDLPGGSMSAMRESLARIAEGFAHDTPMLPGHGEPTDLGRELASNPFLHPQNL